MSSIGSSFVNKTGRTFAPKVAPRRRKRTPTPPVVKARTPEVAPTEPNATTPEISATTAHTELEVTRTVEHDGRTIISTVAPAAVAEEIIGALGPAVKRRRVNSESPMPRIVVTRDDSTIEQPPGQHDSQSSRDAREEGRTRATDQASVQGVNADVQVAVTAVHETQVSRTVDPAEAIRIEIPPAHVAVGPEQPRKLAASQAVSSDMPIPRPADVPTAHDDQEASSSGEAIRSTTAAAHTSALDTVLPSIEEPTHKKPGWTKRKGKQRDSTNATQAEAEVEVPDVQADKSALTSSRRKALVDNIRSASRENSNTPKMVSLTAEDFEPSKARRPRTDKGVRKPWQKKPVERQASSGAPAESVEREESAPGPMSARQRNAEKRKQKAAARNGAVAGLTVEAVEEGAVTKATAKRLEQAKKAAYGDKRSDKLKSRSQSTAERAGDGGPVGHVDEVSDNEDGVQITKKPRKKRVSTPEGAEDVTIVPSMVTMWELASRNVKTGRKSNREKQMAQIDWAAVKARRKEEERVNALNRGRPPPSTTPSPEPTAGGGANGETEELDEDDIDAQLERAAAKNKRKQKGVQTKLVDGQHFIDETSLVIDRHAMANEDMEELEVIEEDDLTKHFNSSTYQCLRRKEPAERVRNWDRWTMELTDQFYDYLGRFGTDFMIISKMFPGRTRREIKSKFVREERLDPERIKMVLSGSLQAGPDTWDIDEFKIAANMGEDELRDPRELEALLEKRREERQVEIDEAYKEAAELARMKKLAGVDSTDEEGEEGAKKAKKKEKKKKKKLHKGKEVGGDEVEILEEYEDG